MITGMSSPFNPSSPQAQSIANLFIWILIMTAVILGLVVGLVGYAIFRFRWRGEKEEPVPHFGSRRLEITWTAIPLLLILIIFIFTVKTMLEVDPAPLPGQRPDLVVTGHQWWWEVDYPKSGVVTANEIHIPTGRKLFLKLEAADVIHDFWVPELGRKEDAIPGHPNYTWIQSNRVGTFLGFCAEYCGASHAWMQIHVVAHPPGEFAKWEQEQLRTPVIPKKQSLIEYQGYQLFQKRTCVNCHAIAGTAAQGMVGPDLSHLASRTTLIAGVLQNNASNMVKWLLNPEKLKPGVHMPNMRLTQEEAEKITAYLETLK